MNIKPLFALTIFEYSVQIHYEKLMKYLRDIYVLYIAVYSNLVSFMYRNIGKNVMNHQVEAEAVSSVLVLFKHDS